MSADIGELICWLRPYAVMDLVARSHQRRRDGHLKSQGTIEKVAIVKQLDNANREEKALVVVRWCQAR
jgi:hypothetical protein